MRLPDWERRLHALVARRQHTPFEWGTHDCYTFACEVVHAVTGRRVDVAGPYRGLRGAYRAIKRLGLGGRYHDAVQNVLGPSAPGGLAQRGDLVLLSQPSELIDEVLGVCLGNCVAYPGPEGLVIRRAVATRYVTFKL